MQLSLDNMATFSNLSQNIHLIPLMKVLLLAKLSYFQIITKLRQERNQLEIVMPTSY